MREKIRSSRFVLSFISMALFLGGCRKEADIEDTPQQAAREALGVKEGSKERTTEARRDVIVQETTKVIDPSTGQVIKTEETRTPVTITEQKTVDRDVDVNAGASKTVVK